MPDFVTPLGAYFGGNYVIVTVMQNGVQYDLQIYPDANNEALRAAGLQTYYYWQVKELSVPKRQDNPALFDFGMTLFKGLLTSDRDIGVTSSEQDMGGGWLTFSTTFGVPDGVIRPRSPSCRTATTPRRTRPSPGSSTTRPEIPRPCSASSRSPRTT